MSDIAEPTVEAIPAHKHTLSDSKALAEAARQILEDNDRGAYTVPAGDMYPHQWLWDSCFIAIGIKHYDVERAKVELLSLLRGQWSNGMLPHMIFKGTDGYHPHPDQNSWRSWTSPYSPDDVHTSGITQPPVLAEAIVQIGKSLSLAERRSWYKMVWPGLLAYHQWLYRERSPHGEGLVVQVHPWETGLDNTPPWMAELHDHMLPLWIRALKVTKLEKIVSFIRRDTRHVPPEQRFTNVDVLALYSVQRRLRRKGYDAHKILNRSMFAIEDLTFNSILIRNNEHLRDIAKCIREEIPKDLDEHMQKTPEKLEELWDPYSQSYYSRDFITHRLLKVPSIAALMPLYAGTIPKEHAEIIVRGLENDHMFGPAFPAPSVPLSSDWFDENRYWQGPSWVNTNWLLIQGLRQYGFHRHADALRETTLEMVAEGGFYEYFNPITGAPLGSPNFSWTAALTIDLLHR